MNRKMMARYFIFAVLIASAALSFAGQQGLPIGGRLIDHQHTTYGDGGILQGLSPVGNFYIFGNNAGNIQISTSITGRLFAWKPASGTFIAGESTDDSFYVNNLGKYSWIGGYNSSSPGDYSLAFGTYTKNNRAASMLLGYYLKNNAGNSVMIGSGPGFGPQPYAVNDDTGSIKFFPFTTTSETRPMLNLKRDGTAEAVGVWNFVSSPTINGIALSTYSAVDNTKVLKTGDTMTGDLYAPAVAVASLTVSGSNFTVGGSTLVVANGRVGVGTNNPQRPLEIYNLQENSAQLSLGYSSSYRYDIGRSTAQNSTTDGLLLFYGNQSNYDGYVFGGISGEKVRILPSGKVGINTPTPATNLDVSGGIRTGIYTQAAMNARTPGAAGEMITVSDAAAPYSLCIATGTAAGAYVLMNTSGHCQ